MATPPSIDLEDFKCPVCMDIFQEPVSLPCSHCFCRGCVIGLRKAPSSDSSPPPRPPSPRRRSTATLIHKPKVHEADQCFVCAICRMESFGYLECRDLETDLTTLEASCPQCNKSVMLCNLRKHAEQCTPPKKAIDTNDIKRIFNKNFLKQLSEPQAQALKKAQSQDNRSTFQCPYCPTANFTVEHLCQHIEEHHLDEDPRRVCPICAAMPWGNKLQVSSHVYEHIVSRHRFEYDTYVNYEQDEETMMAEAIERSMLNR